MDCKDIEERSETHLKKWWNRPFIRTQKWEEDTYEDYCERMSYTQKDDYNGDYKLETEEEFNKRIVEMKKSWFENWENGVRYDVRILDGGAWDRTTNKGSYKTLEEAMQVCKDLIE